MRRHSIDVIWLLSYTLGVVRLVRSEEDAPEGVLDELADEHNNEENKDLFWFAFLVGGVGTVILIVSVCLCLSCVCGVDILFCCRRCCNGLSGPEEEELVTEEYDPDGGFDYGAVEPYGEMEPEVNDTGWGPGTQYNTIDDVPDYVDGFDEDFGDYETFQNDGYDENNANNLRTTPSAQYNRRGNRLRNLQNQNNMNSHDWRSNYQHLNQNSNDKGDELAHQRVSNNKRHNYNQHSNTPSQPLCTRYHSFPPSTRSTQTTSRHQNARQFSEHPPHRDCRTRNNRRHRTSNRKTKRYRRNGYMVLSDTPDHTRCHEHHSQRTRHFHSDHPACRSSCHSSDTLSRCYQSGLYDRGQCRRAMNVNNSAAKSKSEAAGKGSKFTAGSLCCCPCCRSRNEQKGCGSDSSRCDLNAPWRHENHNVNANNKQQHMEYSSGHPGSYDGRREVDDDGRCCLSYLCCCFPCCPCVA